MRTRPQPAGWKRRTRFCPRSGVGWCCAGLLRLRGNCAATSPRAAPLTSPFRWFVCRWWTPRRMRPSQRRGQPWHGARCRRDPSPAHPCHHVRMRRERLPEQLGQRRQVVLVRLQVELQHISKTTRNSPPRFMHVMRHSPACHTPFSATLAHSRFLHAPSTLA